jgi:hypothetical protein
VTVTPAAPPAPADRVKQLLAAGKTTQETADLTGWPRARVVALVKAVSGWLINPKTDTVYQPGNTGMTPSLPDGIEPAPVDLDITRRTEPARKGTADELLARAAQLDDKTVQRQLTKTIEALTALREAVRTVNARVAAEQARQAEIDEARAAVEAAEKLLAEAKARAKELGLKRKPASTPTQALNAGEPSTKDIRAWAVSAGVPCPQFGRVPGAVRAEYDKAHS